MDKQEFLTELETKLNGLPQSDIAEQVSFYREMIDDRMEDGLTEEAAIAELGALDRIVMQILSEIPVGKPAKPGRTLRAWEIVLLALGSPIWLSLALALIVVLLSAYVVLLSLLLCLWAIEGALAASCACFLFSTILFGAKGMLAQGIVVLGGAFLCAGFAVLLWRGCLASTRGVFRIPKEFFLWGRSRMQKQEAEK